MLTKVGTPLVTKPKMYIDGANTTIVAKGGVNNGNPSMFCVTNTPES